MSPRVGNSFLIYFWTALSLSPYPTNYTDVIFPHALLTSFTYWTGGGWDAVRVGNSYLDSSILGTSIGLT